MEIRIITLLLMLFVAVTSANAEMTVIQQASDDEAVKAKQNALINPQNVDFSKCNASFEMNTEKLFYLTISAINANNFEIEEIQSKMGYILFRAVNKSFLASISNIDDSNSMLKITPADNVYFFPYGIVYNIFYYINLNKSEPLDEI